MNGVRWLVWLLPAAGCAGGETILRSAEPLPSAWMQVSILTTGAESSFSKSSRCLELARQHGIWVHTDAPLKLVFSLEENHNRITVGRPGAPPLFDQVRPEWRMESLCSSGLALAAEAIGRKVEVSVNAPPPGCVDRGILEGQSIGVSREAAVEDLKLRAARYGINYVVRDAETTRGVSGLYLGAHGFVCPAQPAAERAAPAPAVPELDDEF